MFRKIQIIGVGAIILNKQGEVLLTQRKERFLKIWDKKWGIPGGRLEFGEDPRDRLYKEMKEELDVKVEIVNNSPILVTKVLNLGAVKFHGIFLGYVCNMISGRPRIANEENYDFGWFKPSDVDFKKCIPTTAEFLAQAFKRSWR